MTEQTPETGTAPVQAATVTMTDEDFDAAISEAVERGRASAPTASESGEAVKYAVYDTTYLRFVGDPFDARKDAAKAAKEHGASGEVREVR